MSSTDATICFTQQDTINLQIPIYASGTTPAVMTAPTGVYTIATSQSATTGLVTKSGTFTQDSTTLLWTMQVTLTGGDAGDTAGLPVGRLFHQAQVADTDGTYETVLAGAVIVKPFVGVATSGGGGSSVSITDLFGVSIGTVNVGLFGY